MFHFNDFLQLSLLKETEFIWHKLKTFDIQTKLNTEYILQTNCMLIRYNNYESMSNYLFVIRNSIVWLNNITGY